MRRIELEQVVESAKPGMWFELMFRPEYPGVSAFYLLAMVDRILSVEETTRLLLYAVRDSDRWDRDRNRTIRIQVLPSFDKEWFVERLDGYLLGIKPC